jgi:hypothetical protein
MDFDYNNYHNFVLIKPIKGSWSFVSYSTPDGQSLRAVRGQDETGKDRSYVVTFSTRERIYRFKRNQKVQVRRDGKLVDMKLYDYIKGSPVCLGGPNFEGVGIFKEIDAEKDAKLIIDAKKRRNEAETKALNLTGPPLKDMAVMLGEFSDNPDIQLRAAIEYAGNDPEAFLSIMEDEHHELKALLKKAVKAGTLRKTGNMFMWEKEVLGGEMDSVEWLINNKDKQAALKKQTNKVK